MKYIEFLLEISKAFKENNRVAILELVVNEPFHAQKCMTENLQLQKEYIKHAKKDSFFQEVLAAGKHPHIGEFTSKPAFIVRQIVQKREFSVYCASKMHTTSDFLSTTENKPGMHQVKKCNTVDDDFLTEQFKQNRNITDFLQIFTNNDKTNKEYKNLKNPLIKITDYEDVPKVNKKEIGEILDQFDNKKLEYIKVKKEQAKPLWEEHKILTRKNPKITEEINFELIKNYNLRAVDAQQRELLL